MRRALHDMKSFSHACTRCFVASADENVGQNFMTCRPDAWRHRWISEVPVGSVRCFSKLLNLQINKDRRKKRRHLRSPPPSPSAFKFRYFFQNWPPRANHAHETRSEILSRTPVSILLYLSPRLQNLRKTFNNSFLA